MLMRQIRNLSCRFDDRLFFTSSKASMASAASVETSQHQLDALKLDQCLLVDEEDNVKGLASKKDCHTWKNIETGNMLHRAFSLFVFNDRDELLLQKRSKFKPTFPGLWSNTCCSHPLFNFNEQDDNSFPNYLGTKKAVQRKLCEELNVKKEDVVLKDLRFVARVLYKARSGQESNWGEHELDYIFFLRSNLNPQNFNTDEVEQLEYVDKNRLFQLIDADTGDDSVPYRFTPWFMLIARSLLKNWWSNDTCEIVDKTIFKL